MWSKWLGFFRKNETTERADDSLLPEVLDEIKEVKRQIRRQNLLLELFKKEVEERLGPGEEKEGEVYEEKRPALAPLLNFSEAFFHYTASLQEVPHFSEGQQEALSIAWQKLEALLACFGIGLIHETGVGFDPRFHEAVERLIGGNGPSVVTKVLQPGYTHEGKVIKPAKVIVGFQSVE